MKIPKDYTAFLHWFKQKTETHWSRISKSDDESWLMNGKWIGLKDEQIKQVEAQYQISFTPEHKEFLKILHSVNKKCPTEFYNEKNEIYTKNEPYFYNWLTDEKIIKEQMNWPYKTIFYDVKKKFWLNSWEKRPKLDDELQEVFLNEYQNAPKLVPIYAHRFVVNHHENAENPILSVWGTDTIVYGWNIKHYLLNELGVYVEGLYKSVYDEEDEMWYGEDIQELKELKLEARRMNENKIIPFWSELIEANK